MFVNATISKGQFFDFNLFRPSISLTGQQLFFNGYDSLSMGVSDYQFSALIPLKKKFEVDIDYSKVFQSKGLKSAFKNMVNPKFYQTFGRIGFGARRYESMNLGGVREAYNISAGITGMRLQLKSLKFRFLFYSLNVRLQEQFDKYKGISPSVSGLIGSARIIDWRSGFFYGVYGNYFGKRMFPIPVIAYYYKLDRNSSFLLAFPYQVQYSVDLSGIRQSFTASVNGFSNGMYTDSLVAGYSGNRINFAQGSFRFSTQSRIKLAKKMFLYLEAGWQDFNRVQYFDGYDVYSDYTFDGNFFVKGRLTMVLGKSLFNPSVFDVDL